MIDRRAELGSERASQPGGGTCRKALVTRVRPRMRNKGLGFIPRAFAGFQLGEKQHEQICNLKISPRRLRAEMIQERREGSRRRCPGRRGGAWAHAVVSNWWGA